MDVNREIRRAADTGKVVLGSDKSIKSLKLGLAKLIIVASNCGHDILADVERYSELSNVPVHRYGGSSAELGLACGKPFFVSVMAILDPGESNILNLVRGRSG